MRSLFQVPEGEICMENMDRKKYSEYSFKKSLKSVNSYAMIDLNSRSTHKESGYAIPGQCRKAGQTYYVNRSS